MRAAALMLAIVALFFYLPPSGGSFAKLGRGLRELGRCPF